MIQIICLIGNNYSNLKIDSKVESGNASDDPEFEFHDGFKTNLEKINKPLISFKQMFKSINSK